ncbi:hypothetical protein [Zavarzinella formosa]|nr:hypothetical protein [Zavarzinella formosa]
MKTIIRLALVCGIPSLLIGCGGSKDAAKYAASSPTEKMEMPAFARQMVK